MASNDKTFYSYFKENMEAIGLQAPESLFGSVTTAIASTTAIVAVTETVGAKVTISELIGAGTLFEGLIVVGACTAAFYAGACLGSLAVASVRSYSDHATKATAGSQSISENDFYSVSDISRYAAMYKISVGYTVQKALHRNPALCKNHLFNRH